MQRQPVHPYQPLLEEADEVDSLWDQLNDEQSREVQQHQSRFRATDPHTSRTNHWVIAQSIAWNTIQRVGVATASAWTAAQQAWRQHPRSSQPSTDLDFDEQFGIQDWRSDPYADGMNEPTTAPTSSNTRPNNNTNSNNAQPNAGYPFVILRQYPSRIALQRARDHWGIVANMDLFLTHLYQYYYDRGLVPMFCKFLVEIVTLLITLWFSRVLLYRVNWPKLITCKDEETCLPHWSDYYYDASMTANFTWTFWVLVQGYTLLFLAYAVFRVWSFWRSLQQAWTCRYIVHEKLGISPRKLQGGAVPWDVVVQKLVQVQDSGEYRMALSSLDPLRIAQRIMRKENFLIAFWNQRLLDVHIGGRPYWCPSLEWSVHWCILNFMFNHKYEIRPAFLLDAPSLERRLKVFGMVHLLLLPFLLLFHILHFLFRNAYDFKTSQQYMGNKQWSTVAQWTFREFNELPHLFERRMDPSYEAADDYLKLFGTSEWMAALGHILVFLGGAIGGVLLVLGVLNDAILLHVQLWGRNLLWYVGIAGIVYSVGKALLPSKDAQPSVTRNLFSDMDTALKEVSSHTHYYPEHWKGRGWDKKVHSQFGLMYDSKVKLFLYELMALVLAPYLLFAKLSKCAPAICEFCMGIKAKSAGIGDVCGFATFDFDVYRDEAWDGKTLGHSMLQETSKPQESLAESVMRTGNLEEATRLHPKPKAREGKMEKSFFSFQSAYPDWKCSTSGQSLVDRVEEYKQSQLANMYRERDLYIKAAARQLETLAKLEETQRKTSSDLPIQANYVPHISPADADAGTHPSPKEPIQRPPSPPPMQTLQGLRPRRTPPSTFGSGLQERHQTANSINSQTRIGATPNIPQEHRGANGSTNGTHPEALTSSQEPLESNLELSVRDREEYSTEQRHILAMSMQTPNELLTSNFPRFPVTNAERGAERQYYWLERFREHLEQQQQQQQQQRVLATNSEPTIPFTSTSNMRGGDEHRRGASHEEGEDTTRTTTSPGTDSAFQTESGRSFS
eukprot:Nitzschia sp. Nitz4//scaffold68_size99682//87472//90537//NITZ4_004576-RA/size99682-snap-gene-0.10-mRNA-1//-1//CDS//3329556629//2153//frame0